MSALASLAQLVIVLLKTSPNGFVIARALEFFDFFFASFPIKLT
ncbi:MAG: hypothetical protein ACOVKF_03130 [Limnohabitans sp.]